MHVLLAALCWLQKKKAFMKGTFTWFELAVGPGIVVRKNADFLPSPGEYNYTYVY